MNIFIALVAGLLPMYIIHLSFWGISTNLFEVLVWLFFIGAWCTSSGRKTIRAGYASLPLIYKIWIVLFFVAATISAVISSNVHNSLGILKGWVITPMIVGLCMYSYAREDAGLRKKIFHALIYSGVIVGLLGFSRLGVSDRIQSLYDVPNSLALFLVPVMVLVAWIGARTKNVLYILYTIILCVAVVMTQSFGALFAIVTTTVSLIFLYRNSLQKTMKIIGLSVLVFGVAYLAFGLISGRVTYLIHPFIEGQTFNSITVRLQLWDVGTRLIHGHPILGVGLGQFEPAYQQKLHELFFRQEHERLQLWYPLQREFVFRDPHNWVISFWLNMGILGFIGFGALNVLAISNWSRAIKNNDIYAQAIILALISIVWFGLVDTIYWKNDLSALWWAFVFFSLPSMPSRISKTLEDYQGFQTSHH